MARYNPEHLSDDDIRTLVDQFAIFLHNQLDHRVYQLGRGDIAELLESYICDLTYDDQRTIVWGVWHLFQEAADIIREDMYRQMSKRR